MLDKFSLEFSLCSNPFHSNHTHCIWSILNWGRLDQVSFAASHTHKQTHPILITTHQNKRPFILSYEYYLGWSTQFDKGVLSAVSVSSYQWGSFWGYVPESSWCCSLSHWHHQTLSVVSVGSCGGFPWGCRVTLEQRRVLPLLLSLCKCCVPRCVLSVSSMLVCIHVLFYRHGIF